MSDATLRDITIIGGGPTGLFALFYAGLRNASVRLLESLPQLGGQLEALYPEKFIYDVAGFPQVSAKELVRLLREQAERFNPEYHLGETVIGLQKLEERHFLVETAQGTYPSRSVIITAGCGAFSPRALPMEEAKRYEGKNLHYFVREAARFAGKHVLIAGGGDSAIDWALMLAPIARQVSLVHRRTQFRAHEQSLHELSKTPTRLLTPYEITALHGGEKIEEVVLSKLGEPAGAENLVLPIDELIVAFGFKASLGPLSKLGLEMERGGIIVNQHMQTSLEGVYAAGDVATYPGKVKLIATGFGEAPLAVSHAKRYVEPQVRLQPGHSSDRSFP